MSTDTRILGADRDYVVIRAAEGAAIAKIQRELGDRGLDVSWSTVNSCVEKHIADVERVRRKMINTGIGSYATTTHRMMTKNNLAMSVYEIVAKVLEAAKNGDSNRIRDLKVVIELWHNLVESIKDESKSIDPEQAENELAEIVGSLDTKSKDSVIADLKKAMPGKTIRPEGINTGDE